MSMVSRLSDDIDPDRALNGKVGFTSVTIDAKSPKIVKAVCASFCHRDFVIHFKFRFFCGSATDATSVFVSLKNQYAKFLRDRLGFVRARE